MLCDDGQIEDTGRLRRVNIVLRLVCEYRRGQQSAAEEQEVQKSIDGATVERLVSDSSVISVGTI